MPTLDELQFPPPSDWQGFQRLCLGLWKNIWNDPNAQEYGRLGQRQNGIDIFGRPNRASDFAAIQCKDKDTLSSKTLTIREIRAEVEKAKRFTPRLKEFIIAYIGPRDKRLQDEANRITVINASKGLFSVTVWGWPDILLSLSDYPEIAQKHYPDLFSLAPLNYTSPPNKSNNSPRESAMRRIGHRPTKAEANSLVRYSRAGDAFHYRWAARRCLRMIYPHSPLRAVVIEGSNENDLQGEYVIDVAEYSSQPGSNEQQISYFQLKHTTVRKDKPLTLSDLKNTIEGFASRYSAHLPVSAPTISSPAITFSVVTNRPIAQSLKRNVHAVAEGGHPDPGFLTSIRKYTRLSDRHLRDFCTILDFADGERDYDAQRYELHMEISQLLAGTVDGPQIDSVVALVQEKVLPNSDHQIIREDILKRFGVTSERDLYPAPPEFEKIDNPIPRRQQKSILESILHTQSPVIIHAAGGVGKSICARQIANALPIGSLGIVYDCFGGGRYRNRSEFRHRHRDALVQIANELASRGLCNPLITQSTSLEDQILRQFLARLTAASQALKKTTRDAVLVILIDAADNAEMAAKEASDPCFVHDLLREQVPDGCRFVAFSRTERIHLLQTPSTVLQLELEPFSKEESLNHLKRYFPNATNEDGLEFHRLTNDGNPRVQANALSVKHDSIRSLLERLGPSGTTVEEQIESQLSSAISNVKERIPFDFQNHVDSICTGLATLPPLIPLCVLAAAAGVNESAIKSFVADLGRPLWLSDASVQFRDEPTETWFRKQFAADVQQVASYISRLEPLAYKYPYVAETLPSLLLQAEKYNDVIELALSDKFLPEGSPIDQRNITVFRLQFAFKAALKAERFADATKLALRAGEEVAGDKRQLDLLTNNVDLVATLQSEQRVQELAYRRMLKGTWDGSENAYSASLLSSVEDFKGEARGYLRAAINWLYLYFDERKNQKQPPPDDLLQDDDIVELTFAHLNLFGVSDAVKFILSWRPAEVVYRTTQKVIKRLIDAGHFETIDQIARMGSGNQYLTIAVSDELLRVGRFPPKDSLRICLDSFAPGRPRIHSPGYSYQDTTLHSIVSFAEACAANKLSKEKILQLLRYYIPIRASQTIASDYNDKDRITYLRVTALRAVLTNNLELNLGDLLPKEYVTKKNQRQHDDTVRKFNEVVGALLPWYIVRTRILANHIGDLDNLVEAASKQSQAAMANRWHNFDTVPYEISQLWIDILVLHQRSDSSQVKSFYDRHMRQSKELRISDQLQAARAAFRLQHLSGIRNELEYAARDRIASDLTEGPETRAEWYVDLARAVLPISHQDAAAYFDYAVEAVSKFGDEIAQRWEAVVSLANRSAEAGHSTQEMAFRLMRCAELVGENVGKEKYWDRDEAIRTCVRLSPSSSLATLSRWRDRDVGWFSREIKALAHELVKSQSISASAGWSLSAFFEGDGLVDFAALCTSNESSSAGKLHIFDAAVRDLTLNQAPEASWRCMSKLAQEHSFNNTELDDVLNFYAQNREENDKTDSQRPPIPTFQDKSEPINFDEILLNIDLATSSGISSALSNFQACSTGYRDNERFWQEVIRRVNENDASKFLQELVQAETADSYDIRAAISSLPQSWKNKASVKRNWPNIVLQISKRFATEFAGGHGIAYFLNDFPLNDNPTDFVYRGILDGLSGNSHLSDAETFFGFVDIACHLISPQDASDLLDFALARFELHVDSEFADGPWAPWLAAPQDTTMALAGFIWSALGSPRSEIRWRAAHCVRRLGENGCKPEIDALMKWMDRDKVEAFGSRRFPFYNLHARQYLLIALARLSIDNPQILRGHHATFVKCALGATPHVLIRRFSAEIALNIETAFPGTFDEQRLQELRSVNTSRLPLKQLKSFDYKTESVWHASGEIDADLKFHHGWDFDRYWFEPLGDVFGISGDQVAELATQVVVKEFGIATDGSYGNDPRSELWQSSSNGRETHNDHGSYPQTDDYSFYLSYHAMLVVAGKLIQRMPVLHRPNWYENEWNEWLDRHLLTRKDGKWLADRRDPHRYQNPIGSLKTVQKIGGEE